MERLPDSAGGTAAGGSLRLSLLLFLLGLISFPGGARGFFPLAMKDDRGAAVRLSSPPRRVVSLAPNLTEIVFLLGQGEKLVGVTRFCNYPPEAARLPRVGGIVDPDIERIVAATPDLILCTTDGNPKERIQVLEEMGIPCFAVGPQNLDAIFDAIERVGALFGIPERGKKESGALRARAERASAGKRLPSPGVLFVVSTSPVIAAGKGTFLDELVVASGGRNAAARYGGRYPRLSVEDLVAVRPDIILVASMTGGEGFPPALSRWKEIPAFRNGDIVSLDGDLVTRPGPRMVAALERVSEVLSAWRARRPPPPGGGREADR